MQTYVTADDMWVGMIEACLSKTSYVGPSREGAMREVVGWSGTLEYPDRNSVLNPRRAVCPYYSAAEVLWYLSLSSDVRMIQAYAPQSYPQWTEPDGTMYGAVGGRLDFQPGYYAESNAIAGSPRNQLEAAIALLRAKPDTRQCVVTLWDAGDLVHALRGTKRNLPCYTAFQFFVRNKCVEMVTTMRSNDVWLGAPYDVFAFTCIQRYIADRLDLALGPYHHHVGSLHVYEKYAVRAAEAATEAVPLELKLMPNGWAQPRGLLPLKAALFLEEDARRKANAAGANELIHTTLWERAKQASGGNDRGMLVDLAVCAAQRWLPGSASVVVSPRLNALIVAAALKRGRKVEPHAD